MLGNYLQQTLSADDIFRCIFFLGALKVNHKPDDDQCFKTIKLISNLIAREFPIHTEADVIKMGFQ